MRKITTMVVVMVLAVALSAGAAFAVVKHGTNAAEILRGTPQTDTIYAYGGADVVYGYGSTDFLYGGNEIGWGDKIRGGTWGDRIFGQSGKDGLYGERGNDRINGGPGADLVSGGSGSDHLDGGPGADRIDARDDQRDTVVIRFNEGDVVYYDRGLDVLLVPASSQGSTGLTAAKAAEKDVELSEQRPPEGLFEPFGKVLVEHNGERRLVAEGALEGHLAHGDEIIDPTGRAAE
jgi:hypothetical protein